MKNKFAVGFLCIVLCSSNYKSAAQAADSIHEPEVGKPCPAFKFNSIDYYSKKKVSNADFKGKWLVIDFWLKYCSGCISSFPYVSRTQEEFRDSLQYLMVTYDNTEHHQIYS